MFYVTMGVSEPLNNLVEEILQIKEKTSLEIPGGRMLSTVSKKPRVTEEYEI